MVAAQRRGASKRAADPPEAAEKRAKAEPAEQAPAPPKGAARRGRAKKEEQLDDSELSPARPSGNDHTAPPELPRNTTLPASIQYAPRPDGQVRVMTWNITSLKSSDGKGLMRYLRAEDADVVVLTETKVNDVPSHAGIDAMYRYRYWGIGEKKGYAGIAVLSKLKPDHVTYGLPGFNDPSANARMITLEFPHTVLVGTYAVNAGDGLKTLESKMRWNDALERHLQSHLQAGKHLIWCGDLNVVWDDRDLAGASKKWNKSAGYTQAECDAHRRVLSATGMCDAWRRMHADAVGHYTYYGWRGMCRPKGSGWRLDSFIVTEKTLPRVKACEIRHEIYGASDHVPIMADIEGPL